MKTLLTRLKSTRGETLIESMIAILIFTFASILFLTLVTSAANINIRVNEADESFQAQQLAVEIGGEDTTVATVVLADTTGNELLKNENYVVTTAEGDDALYAYYLPTSTPAQGVTP